MSPIMLQTFAFMACTFGLGLLLGWTFWRFGGISKAALETKTTEVDFWRSKVDQSRNELWTEQANHTALREEFETFKKRVTGK